MNEEKLVKLIKEGLKEEFSGLDKKFVTKNDFVEFQKEMREFRLEMRTELKEIRGDIDELKPSAKSLDKILVQYPIERITRLEKQTKLSSFTPVVEEE